ncbi:isochorismatase, partial [Bacillus wiedmannii]
MKLSFHIFFFMPLRIFFTFRIVHKKTKEHHLF